VIVASCHKFHLRLSSRLSIPKLVFPLAMSEIRGIPIRHYPKTLIGTYDGQEHFFGGRLGEWLDWDSFIERHRKNPVAYVRQHHSALLTTGEHYVSCTRVPDPYPRRKTYHGTLLLRTVPYAQGITLVSNLEWSGPTLDATLGSPAWRSDYPGHFQPVEKFPGNLIDPDIPANSCRVIGIPVDVNQNFPEA
jgi:hypothetical protein